MANVAQHTHHMVMELSTKIFVRYCYGYKCIIVKLLCHIGNFQVQIMMLDFKGFCIITFKLNETYLGMRREWKVMEIGIS